MQNRTLNTAFNYHAFGSSMAGRSFSNNSYRFGFNGMEKFNETANDNYDFGARIYDSRIGRWLALDPLAKKYPMLNPYNFVSNSPLMFIDPDGEKIIVPKIENRDYILSLINKRALGVFEFDVNGYLKLKTVSGDETKFSKYYQLKLLRAMYDDKIIVLDICKENCLTSNGNPLNLEERGEGTTEGVTFDVVNEKGITNEVKGAKITISTKSFIITVKDENDKNEQYEMCDDEILMHEILAHGLPFIGYSDTGDGIKNENKARKECNLPKRLELDHPETNQQNE